MDHTDRPIKICFVNPYCYPLFNPGVRTMFGGWEVRIAQIARGLAAKPGFQVTVLVADHGQPEREVRDGVCLAAWRGRSFWGIPAPGAANGAPLPAQDDGNEPEFTMEHVRAQLGLPKPLPARLKDAYKALLPWRVRIVFYGILVGLKNSLVLLFKDWFYALKWIVQTPFRSLGILFSSIRDHVRIARRSIGHIGNEAIYQETIQIYDQVDADIFVVPGNSRLSAEAAFYCAYAGKVFVMLAGSDVDFRPEYLLYPEKTDIYGDPFYLKEYVLKHATTCIVQNAHQRQLAQQFGLSPIIIHNPISLRREFPKQNDGTILWVGNTDERVKRPSLVLELAKRLPAYRFAMVVTANTEEDYRRLKGAEDELPNLFVTTRVPYTQIEKYFASAALLINTSSFEGFPNTFLQAGKYGVPVVSLKVNPNGMISSGCGVVCGNDLETMKCSIERLMQDSDSYEQHSRNILQYIETYHAQDKVIEEFAAVFRKIEPNHRSKGGD